MRTNVFSIPPSEVAALRKRLSSSGMTIIKQVGQAGWSGDFYYSSNLQPSRPSWADTFSDYFLEVGLPISRNHFAAFVFTKADRCRVLSFGKSHFYIRPHCDYDYGIEVAKRVANEKDVRQTSAKRFNARRKKDIRSFAKDSVLDIESGESVDFLQAGVTAEYSDRFGKTGKFGTSVLLAPDIAPGEIGSFLDALDAALAGEPLFPVARTIVISEPAEVERLDEKLLEELLSPKGTTDFAHNSYDLYGVDFVFTNDGKFVISSPGGPKVEYETLTVGDIKDYIASHSVPRDEVLKMKVRQVPDDAPAYARSLKESVDFIADDDSRVLLNGGKWMHFNQDYLDALDEALRAIKVEVVEDQYKDIVPAEPEFNEAAVKGGYEYADKNFDIFTTRSSTPVEAWDLKKGARVYAVKFGTPQKLGYVCDQATSLLELIRNSAGLRQVPEFESYCLWFGYRAQRPLTDITHTGSIIFKQKIEAWARKARDVGVEPVIKISRKLKEGVDTELADES